MRTLITLSFTVFVIFFLYLSFEYIDRRLGKKCKNAEAIVERKKLETQDQSFAPAEDDINKQNNLLYRIYVKVDGLVYDIFTIPTIYKRVRVGDKVEVAVYQGLSGKKYITGI